MLIAIMAFSTQVFAENEEKADAFAAIGKIEINLEKTIIFDSGEDTKYFHKGLNVGSDGFKLVDEYCAVSRGSGLLSKITMPGKNDLKYYVGMLPSGTYGIELFEPIEQYYSYPLKGQHSVDMIVFCSNDIDRLRPNLTSIAKLKEHLPSYMKVK
ncbi:MAG: hypothetical protein H6625_11750 [Bdellovibrionaceae bacterium]|nr:hypothetical protein [Pseudobdellovibrionaceae bacterium]